MLKKGEEMKMPSVGLILTGMAIVLGGTLPTMTANAAPEDKEPIKLEIPEPFFGGTPLDGCFPHLEKMTFEPRPPFLAPKGTTLLSRGKPVSSSVKSPIFGKLEMVVDGDKGSDRNSMIELDAGPQWVQIDLQKTYEAQAIILWHFRQGSNFFFDVVVQVSNDPNFKSGVTTLYNADDDNSAGLGIGKDLDYVETHEGRLIDAKGIKSRYVRCYSNGSAWSDKNNYVEIEVFGKAAE